MANRQKGFGHLETFLVVLVLVVIGAVGIWVYKNNNNSTTSSSSQPAAQIADAPAVEDASDLDKASQTLEEVSNGSDTGEIDALSNEVDSL